MPYVTSIERRGIQQGILQKAREAVIEILEVRFADVPRSIAESIQGTDDLSRLNRLLKQAATTASLVEFESILEPGAPALIRGS